MQMQHEAVGSVHGEQLAIIIQCAEMLLYITGIILYELPKKLVDQQRISFKVSSHIHSKIQDMFYSTERFNSCIAM